MEATSAIFRATNNASLTETMIAYSVKKDKLLFLKSLALNLFFEIENTFLYLKIVLQKFFEDVSILFS